MNPDEMAQFILDSNNVYELGKWSSNQRQIRAPMYKRGYYGGTKQRTGSGEYR